MSQLHNQECEACRAGAPLATPEETIEWMQELSGWEIISVDNISRLQRTFGFENFIAALEFTNKVGALAEEVNHHPEIITEWGKVTVSWWSHKIKGLHRNDFIMAAKTDTHYS
ncbi:Pterin-4-alpha-carbinolamine dehydratase [hydrothermal vent metagenome]|uniref:4a-hydroxytetrahydrobiopterin dehydratase n=1 Tax=hydrothermal vent metagenome TaxID=652676 RepID=A0A3B0YWN5_9ZZZZ